jgi:hypothetical protein
VETAEPTTAEYAHLIESCLAGVADRLGIGRDRATWTSELTLAVANIGIEHRWDVCVSLRRPPGSSNFDAAWLYDLVWYRSDEQGLSRVELVLESEWSMHWEHIRYDFEKLLIAKVPLKLLVFEAWEAQIEARFDALKKGIRHFMGASTDETYVLAALNSNNSGFRFLRA